MRVGLDPEWQQLAERKRLPACRNVTLPLDNWNTGTIMDAQHEPTGGRSRLS